ncbi:MAG: LysR family transcriptional regulator [Azoarcus sp.]|jgi:DNA-binding transcriptional LysR family regulator|nr:LysR family transcriptional regulator [Azoarcus sp.]
MTLQQLKYFIEAVGRGSINKAAEALYIAQPSLSSAIKDLEAELGLELFTRTPKGIALTKDGVEFMGYARQVVEQASLLEQRYMRKKPSRCLCSISTQHYAFAVNAFVNMILSKGHPCKRQGDDFQSDDRLERLYHLNRHRQRGLKWRQHHRRAA